MRRYAFLAVIVLAAILGAAAEPAVALRPACAQGLAPRFQNQPADLTVYFYRDGQAVAVPRAGLLSGDRTADAQALIVALLAGPTSEEAAAGLTSALAAGCELVELRVDGESATVDLSLPPNFVEHLRDPALIDAIVDQVVKTLHPVGLNRILVRASNAASEWVPLSDLVLRPVVAAPTPPPNEDPLPAVSPR